MAEAGGNTNNGEFNGKHNIEDVMTICLYSRLWARFCREALILTKLLLVASPSMTIYHMLHHKTY